MHVTPISADMEHSGPHTPDDTTTLLPKTINFIPTAQWKDKFLFIVERRHGISNLNVLTYFLTVVVMVIGLSHISVTNQFLLQTYLKVPHGTEGRVAGDLSFYTEVVMVFMSWIWGALSDALGTRKPLFVIALAVIGVCIAIQPLANSFAILLVIRLLFGAGISAMYSVYLATVADYTVDKDRGKASGLLGLSLNSGSMIASFILVNIPLWLTTITDLSEMQAGYIGFAFVGLLNVLMAIFTAFFLHDGEAYRQVGLHEAYQEKKSSLLTEEDKKNFWRKLLKIFIEGVTAMKDPIVILAYISAFVSRMDVSTVTFTSLWISQELIAQGASQTAAIGQAGFVSGIATLLSILTAPTLGFFGDRINRTLLLCFVSVFATFAFGMSYFLPDVVHWWVYIWAASTAASNFGTLVCSNILITQAAPKESRGSVMGVYMLMAALGVMFSTKTGGYLFDINHAYPYLLVACGNALLVILCILALTYQGIKWCLNRYRAMKLVEDEIIDPQNVVIN
jgi:MFS family permease